jgi:hypothetical protein
MSKKSFKLSPFQKWFALKLIRGLLDDLRTKLSGLTPADLRSIARIAVEKYKVTGIDPAQADTLIFSTLDMALTTSRALIDIAEDKIKL